MEEFLKSSLGYKVVRAVGGRFGDGGKFDADGQKLFIKTGSGRKSKLIFEGQLESLRAIEETESIRVPRPIKVLEGFGGDLNNNMIVMECLDLKSIGSKAEQLGRNVARLHLHNNELGEKGDPGYVENFGFDIPTPCGEILQGNKWDSNWVSFYVSKLNEQFNLQKNDAAAQNLWAKLQPVIPTLFRNLNPIRPSLLHGDLWSGNVAQADGHAVVYDPGSFYGHHEFDLGIAGMFGMPRDFFKEYHKLIPKAEGFEKRHQLYQLFHYLNHWNHFGSGYREQSLNIMRNLIK